MNHKAFNVYRLMWNCAAYLNGNITLDEMSETYESFKCKREFLHLDQDQVRKLELISEYYSWMKQTQYFHVMANVYSDMFQNIRVDFSEIINNYNYFIEDSYFSGMCKHIDWNYPKEIDWNKTAGIAFVNHDISGIDFWFAIGNTEDSSTLLDHYMNQCVTPLEIEKFQRQRKKLEDMIEKAAGYVIMDQ